MSNVIIIPTCNLYRIRTFDKYFNVFNIVHDHRFIFVADDRHKISREEYLEVFSTLKNRHLFDLTFSTELLSSVSPLFSDVPYFADIVKNYPLSIKLLIFIWAKHELGIEKCMLLDDDVLFLRPVDHVFAEHNFVKKSDMISWLCQKSLAALQDAYPEIDVKKFENDKKKINSGSIIYTWDDSHNLLGFVKQFFGCKSLHKFIMERAYLHSIGKGHVGKGTGWGRSWLMEQYTYGMFMHSIGWDKFADFGAVVNTGVQIPKDDKPRKLTRVPNIVHFLPANKMPLYEYYIGRLEQYLNEQH